MRFVVFSPMYNNEKYVEKHLQSVLEQTHVDFTHVVVDDASTDDTINIVKRYGDKITLVENKKNIKWVANAVTCLPEIVKDEDVIVCLDGDDWFAHNRVLETLNCIYEREGCWLTYGQFSPTDPHWPGHRCDSAMETIQNRTFRKARWAFSHLKTFKAFLFFAIKQEDLMLPSGSFIPCTYDLAIMFPMLEMCSEGKIRFIEEVLCVYNVDNPTCVEKINKHEQLRLDRLLRQKPIYDILER